MKLLIIALIVPVLGVAQTRKVETYYDPYQKTMIRESYTTTNSPPYVKHGTYHQYAKDGKVLSKVEYKNGKRNGKAINYMGIDGDYCDGKPLYVEIYKDDKRNGEQLYYQCREGEYKLERRAYYENELLFEDEMYYSDGSPKYKIYYDGECKEWHPNGTLAKEYALKDGLEVGEVKVYFEDGGLKETYEIDHEKRLNFKELKYAPNGNLVYSLKWFRVDTCFIVEQFDTTNGAKVMEEYRYIKVSFDEYSTVVHGTRTEWYPDGTIKSEINYHVDKLHGDYITYHENGQIAEKGKYEFREHRSSQPVGIWTYYYPSGQKKAEGKYNPENDQNKMGLWKAWHENGNLSAEGEFDDYGRRTGHWKIYYENGNIKEEADMKNGKVSGEFLQYDESGNLIKE